MWNINNAIIYLDEGYDGIFMTAPLVMWRRYIHAAIAILRSNDCRLYSLSSHSYAMQIRRTSAEKINITNYIYMLVQILYLEYFTIHFLIAFDQKIICISVLYAKRKLKFSSTGLDTLPVRSRNVVPTLLSSSFNQRAISGRWAHLSPVLFNFRRTLCPISSNNSLAQSSTWRLVSSQFGPTPVRTLMLIRPLLYTKLLDDKEIQL